MAITGVPADRFINRDEMNRSKSKSGSSSWPCHSSQARSSSVSGKSADHGRVLLGLNPFGLPSPLLPLQLGQLLLLQPFEGLLCDVSIPNAQWSETVQFFPPLLILIFVQLLLPIRVPIAGKTINFGLYASLHRRLILSIVLLFKKLIDIAVQTVQFNGKIRL
uniref:Uncharacterized protein n=1 Tax=Arundo donax TaxID=35708 RepID=A0A0A9E1X7_ARUDO